MTEKEEDKWSTEREYQVIFMTECSTECMYHTFCIHSSVDGHLGGSHILVIVNNATLNIGVHVSLWISNFFSDICPGVEFLGHMEILLLAFWKTSILFSNGCTNLHSQVYKGSLCSTPSPIFARCGLFDDSHSDMREKIVHCGFDWHFPDD